MNAQEQNSFWPLPSDDAYSKALARFSPAERPEFAFALHQAVVDGIRGQLARFFPELSEREIKIKAAEILYYDDPMALKLLEKARREAIKMG